MKKVLAVLSLVLYSCFCCAGALANNLATNACDICSVAAHNDEITIAGAEKCGVIEVPAEQYCLSQVSHHPVQYAVKFNAVSAHNEVRLLANPFIISSFTFICVKAPAKNALPLFLQQSSLRL